ncbi:hypothetical protein [Metabacillus fastidiosus]|uniref:hypothetical protein n=1 Tax=Metabacillus fastidiosus TaxID=1458 RepID=UPI003D2DAFAD
MKCREEIEETILNGRTPKEYIEDVGGTWNDFINLVNQQLNQEKIKEIEKKVIEVKNNGLSIGSALKKIYEILIK